MVTVELHPAFIWDCPECGRENFQRTVSTVLDPDDEGDAETIRLIHRIDDGDEIPDGMIVRSQHRPNRVTCRHCEDEFNATDSSVDGSDLDDDD